MLPPLRTAPQLTVDRPARLIISSRVRLHFCLQIKSIRRQVDRPHQRRLQQIRQADLPISSDPRSLRKAIRR